jgi:hypothetical protein
MNLNQSEKYIGRRRMNISTKAVLISFLAISIAAGIVLYPGAGNAATTRISGGSSYIKIIEIPIIDISMEFGEPGESPWGVIGLLGSTVSTSCDDYPSVLTKDTDVISETSIPRFVNWFVNFSNQFSFGRVRGR